jgi:hypothetical protein
MIRPPDCPYGATAQRQAARVTNSQLPLATYQGNNPFAYRHWCPPGNLWRDRGHSSRHAAVSGRAVTGEAKMPVSLLQLSVWTAALLVIAVMILMLAILA